MNNTGIKKKKGVSAKKVKSTRNAGLEKEVIKFFATLGLENLPDSNNKITMFPYEPFQISLSAASERKG